MTTKRRKNTTAAPPETERPAPVRGKTGSSDHSGIEEALGSDEVRYRRIVDTAYEGIWVLDDLYYTTFVNSRMAEMLGYAPDEVLGKNMGFFLFEEDLADLDKKAGRRRQGIAEQYDRRLRRKDMTTLWTHVSATPILDKEGFFQGSFAMFTDISERKVAEEALLRSELKYRSIVENAVEGIFQSTPDGRLITVNPAMARIFGYRSTEEMVASVSSIGQELYANAEDRKTFEYLLEHDGMAGGFEAQFVRKDHTFLWGSLNVRAIKDDGGNLLRYEGTLEDITARKKAEEDLTTSEEKYRNIFENALEGIFQVTPDGRYLSANPSLAKIHGFTSPGEMIEAVTDIAHQLYVDPSRRAELKRLTDERDVANNFEVMMRRKDMSLHWVSINSRAVRDTHGAIRYYEGTIEDITSRKLAEEEVAQLRKTLKGSIEAMSAIAETRDPGTAGHQKRVARLATAIAEELRLPASTVDNVKVAALIHDIGKISVPAEILSKPVKLTEQEYGLVRTHPRTGYGVLKDAGFPYPIAEIVLQHHERFDGSGYPQGLKGTEILTEALIIAVADVVEAMVSDRPYRRAFSLEAALKEIQQDRGTRYDPGIVDVCVTLFRKKGFQLS